MRTEFWVEYWVERDMSFCFSGFECLWRRLFAECTQKNQRKAQFADGEKGECVRCFSLSALKALRMSCVNVEGFSCFSETGQKCVVWKLVWRPRPSSVWPHLYSEYKNKSLDCLLLNCFVGDVIWAVRFEKRKKSVCNKKDNISGSASSCLIKLSIVSLDSGKEGGRQNDIPHSL